MSAKEKPKASSSQRRTKFDLTATAHHEAGHAVISIALGVPVNRVSILPDKNGERLGTCGHPNPYQLHDGSRRDTRRLARCCILISYAGIPAQRLVDPNPASFHAEGDDRSAFDTSKQFQVFPRFMQYVGDDYHRAYLETLRKSASRLVHRNAVAIRHLAEILLKARTMTGEQIEAALVSFALASS